MKKTDTFFIFKSEIIKKYLDGYTVKELSIEYNIYRRLLTKLLKNEKIKIRGRGEPTERQIKKIKQTFLKKYGVVNIGQLYHPHKSKKLSEFSLKTKRWAGKNNPNYGNKIGKANGFKNGLREDLSLYFRSSWEANIARILNYLKIEWIYEKNRYEINDKETYTPDFYLPKKNEFIEVKGRWLDDSKRKFEEFKKKYSVKIFLIDEKFYKWLIKRFRGKIYLE